MEQIFETYAIFKSGGKQYQALLGKTVALEQLEGNVGDTITFTEVLFRKENASTVEFGTPFLTKPVTATIVKHMKGPKIIIFRFKRRKKSRVKKGHRQPMTIVRIETI
jgi:large subunit ribosomal protein L21